MYLIFKNDLETWGRNVVDTSFQPLIEQWTPSEAAQRSTNLNTVGAVKPESVSIPSDHQHGMAIIRREAPSVMIALGLFHLAFTSETQKAFNTTGKKSVMKLTLWAEESQTTSVNQNCN